MDRFAARDLERLAAENPAAALDELRDYDRRNASEGDRTMTENTAPKHGCGMCGGPLEFDRMVDSYPTWQCRECGWWHIAKDCCEQHHVS